MNERISIVSETSDVEFVNNDLNFRFMNEIPDTTLLLPDGIHLSYEGVLRLLKNLDLHQKTKCNLKPESNALPAKRGAAERSDKSKKLHTKSKNGVTLFFGRESVFSNLHTETPIFIDGKNFYCNEQYYTYEMARYFRDEDAARNALLIQDPYELVSLQKKIKNVDRKAWFNEAKRTLFLANTAKYSQNSSAREALLRTGDNIIGEASYNRTWGIGSSLYDPQSMNLNWKGQNTMGNILMDIRDTHCQGQNKDQTFRSSTVSTPTRSSQSNQYDRFCWFCGESNHISKNCKHGQKVQCNSCLSLGHKAKFCSYC